MNTQFIVDERLRIPLPNLTMPWDDYTEEIQQEILVQWETIRGRIPDRIAELEAEINSKLHDLGEENNFPRSCELNSDISELASIINDLWLYYRMNQNVSEKIHM
ncbi:hypothetical protein ACOI1C_15895 [Bacillus sp. DJP31]|uniref:hypothetical protein n=1 Tax=Bacillus sp. DJP31 TaxID=3409789 RepID=UPI003BB60EDA